ncbi:hypothetical protein ACR79N_07875 [Sphingobacterium siyangense]|uniref:hypothetical protein n=1 Tax=Sphingobacterium siyangense TaxID=459529 RepID=UPI003DA386CD
MLDISKNTKVFVYCPAQVVTGGAELLHQLVDLLNRQGRQAFIVYYGDKENEVPSAYSKYNIRVSDSVEDSEKNIVVFYEAVFDKIKNIKKAQIFLWWLSVDNFFIFGTDFINILDLCRYNLSFGLKIAIYRLFQLLFKGKNLFKNTFSIKWLKNLDAVNAYQSEYAQNFLINHGFKLTTPLSDYINTDFYTGFSTVDRENVVLYNPKKGFEFTKKLIERAKHINFLPLENMSREQLVNVFNRSKLYIDFGYHPGKDRLPREVALNGCCVITGMRGSARFFEDVPLANVFKFDEKAAGVDSIIARIDGVLANYEKIIPKYDFYRTQILSEKEIFEEQVRRIFKVNS